MSAPLTGIQRVRLTVLVEQLKERRMHTKAADLRQALDLIAELSAAAWELLSAVDADPRDYPLGEVMRRYNASVALLRDLVDGEAS